MTRRSEKGSALVAVIWLIALLSLLTIATIRVVGFDIEVTSSKLHGFRAWQLAEMGIAVGSNPNVEPGDPILNQFEGDEGFKVEIVSEGSKFNINSILQGEDKLLLENLFIDWGMDIDQASAVSDSLGDWIDADDETALNGAEIEYYEELGRINQPFNRPFYHLDEMRMVRGMDLVEALQPNWRNWFTVWSSGALDLNEADADLIAAAAEVTYEEAAIIPEIVRGPDGIRYTDDDAPFQSAQEALALIGVDGSLRPDIVGRFSTNETSVRIVSTGYTPGSEKRIIVVLRNRTGRPMILERTEEVVP